MTFSRGESQKQLAALVATAKANELQFDDILPEELKDHFEEMVELKRARQYIKELEGRETELQAEKAILKKDLVNMQKEIANLPMEHQARMVELHQAQRQIALYKETSEDLSRRAERYRHQLEDIVSQKQATASAAEKIENLQAQIEDQQTVIDKLLDDNRKSEAMFQQLRESDLKALGRKDKQLAKKHEMIVELREQVKDARISHPLSEEQSLCDADDAETSIDGMTGDSLALQEQNIDLLQRNLSILQQNKALEEQYVMVKVELSELMAAYDCSTGQDRKAQFFAAAVSEIKTLNHFYNAAFGVLREFAKGFHAAEASEIPSPAYIDDQLDLVQDALAGYNSVKQVVRAITDVSGIDEVQTALYVELDSLGVSAAESMSSLEALHIGVWRFLNRLSDDPKLLSSLNAATSSQIEERKKEGSEYKTEQ